MKKKTINFIFSKLFELIITLLMVTIISFMLMKLSPIDPAEAYARRNFSVSGFSDKQLNELRNEMGLNKSIIIQYIDWAKSALKLEFGTSLVSGRPVFDEVSSAIKITASIVLISGGIQIIGILCLGCICYKFKKTLIGNILAFICIACISIPAFFLASSFIDVFAVKYHLISVTGNNGFLGYLVPAFCLSVGCTAFFAQLLSNNIEKEMNEDSVFYARCRGLSDRRILLNHVLPQAIVGILPNFFQMLGLCMAGAAILERVFSLPGLGYLIIDSVLYRDAPMIHATVLFLAFALVIFNIISDILRSFLQKSAT